MYNFPNLILQLFEQKSQYTHYRCTIKCVLVMNVYYKRIRELREDNDILQKDVAKVLNTTQQHYSRIETGATEITADRVVTLAKFYNVTTDYILGLSDQKER